MSAAASTDGLKFFFGPITQIKAIDQKMAFASDCDNNSSECSVIKWYVVYSLS
jgi:hypothetical protein